MKKLLFGLIVALLIVGCACPLVFAGGPPAEVVEKLPFGEGKFPAGDHVWFDTPPGISGDPPPAQEP